MQAAPKSSCKTYLLLKLFFQDFKITSLNSSQAEPRIQTSGLKMHVHLKKIKNKNPQTNK